MFAERWGPEICFITAITITHAGTCSSYGCFNSYNLLQDISEIPNNETHQAQITDIK
jgi:hypothetical protein